MNKDNKNNNLNNMSENDIDPRLRFDAFMAGVKEGGLRSVNTINLLVCYIIANIDGNVTGDVIASSIGEGMLANYFEVKNAISNLKEHGTIIESEDGVLSLNDRSMANIDLIEKDLPYTVREKSMHLVQKALAKEKYRREVKAEIVKKGDAYEIILAIGDGKKDYLNLKLFAPSEDQAQMIKEKFITDPVKVYENLIETIFSNEE